MTQEKKFRTDTDLWPGDPAFSASIYRIKNKPWSVFGLDFRTQIICSPRKTGKTTQVNFISSLHMRASRLADQSKMFIHIPKREPGLSEPELRDLLGMTLNATQGSSFAELLLNSTWIQRYQHRKVLALIDVDNLQEDALRWLLWGIRLLELEETPQRLKLQVLVDGSFALDTITWGPNSELPMPQYYPREFTRSSQNEFISERLQGNNLNFEQSAYDKLWQATHGDKYLTQAICDRISKKYSAKRKVIWIDKEDISDSIRDYVREDPKLDHLKPDLLRSMFLISEQSPEKESYLKTFLARVSQNWDYLSVNERMHAYKGGLIKRTNQGIRLRAPLIRSIFDHVAQRVHKTRLLLTSNFDPHKVAEPFREQAVQIAREIVELSYKGTLTGLQVGSGTKTNQALIQIDNIAALNQNQYKNILEIQTDDSVSIGGRVWLLAWAWEDSPGQRWSEVRVLPAINH